MTQSETAIREGDLCMFAYGRHHLTNELVVVVRVGRGGLRPCRVLRPNGVIQWAAQTRLRLVQREG